MSELETYLEFLYGENSGHVYVPTRPGGSWETSWFEWPRQKLALTDFIRTQSRVADVHIGTALYKKQSGLKEGVLSSNVVWCEFDGNFTGDWKGIPEPNLMIQSSGEQNVHCYWRVETLTEVSAIEEITYRLAHHLEADEACWNANRVLRPPETFNYKRGTPLPVQILKLDTKTTFSSKDFDRAPVVTKRPQPFVTTDVIEWYTLKQRVPIELIRKVEKFNVKEGERSSFYFKLAADLARLNFSEVEIFSALYVLDDRIRKYADRNDRLERLASIAAKVVLPIISSRKVESHDVGGILDLQEAPISWVLPGMLPDGEVGILFGQPGVGKTQLAIWMGWLLSAGQPVFFDEPQDPIKVLFFSKEIHRSLLRVFLLKQSEVLGQFRNKNFILAFPDATHGIESIRDLLEEVKPHLFIVDSLIQMVPSFKEEEVLKKTVDALTAVSYPAATLFIHHTTKAAYDSKDGPTLRDSYGGMYPLTVASTVISLHGEGNNLYVKLLKNRFGPLTEFNVHRTEHLTFEVNRASRQPDGTGKFEKSPGRFKLGNFGGHGDKLD